MNPSKSGQGNPTPIISRSLCLTFPLRTSPVRVNICLNKADVALNSGPYILDPMPRRGFMIFDQAGLKASRVYEVVKKPAYAATMLRLTI